jgi:hypothetical protein
MTLTDDEKLARKRQRMLEKAREYTTGTYCRKYVAPLFQRMIRAEWAAAPTTLIAIWCTEPLSIPRRVGECVCVTCGKRGPWSSGLGGFHCGHFLASRRNAILLEESNVAPQCSSCNRYRSGAPQEFRRWMEIVHGEEEIARLEQLKTQVRSFSREELVDLRLEYQRRLAEAELKMQGPFV